MCFCGSAEQRGSHSATQRSAPPDPQSTLLTHPCAPPPASAAAGLLSCCCARLGSLSSVRPCVCIATRTRWMLRRAAPLVAVEAAAHHHAVRHTAQARHTTHPTTAPPPAARPACTCWRPARQSCWCVGLGADPGRHASQTNGAMRAEFARPHIVPIPCPFPPRSVLRQCAALHRCRPTPPCQCRRCRRCVHRGGAHYETVSSVLALERVV